MTCFVRRGGLQCRVARRRCDQGDRAPVRRDHADGQGCARSGGRPRAGSAGVFLEALSHVRRVAVTSALP
ncbi:unnamed protein product [[Actinomadura] parvosata subsp. kistnae]|nr:unnamed protein product [Actinomadura parvosata subsp. kistnae]